MIRPFCNIVSALLGVALFATTGCAQAGDELANEELAGNQQSAQIGDHQKTDEHTQTSAFLETKGAATQQLRKAPEDAGVINVYDYRVVNVLPHDETAFTQGLFFHRGELFESTGMNGESVVRSVDIQTGEVIRERAIDPAYFGEGSTAIGEKVFSLSWTSGTGFIHQVKDLAPAGTFSYEGEGWGLTTDGTSLIMSDGTSVLRLIDPVSLSQSGRIPVTLKGQAIRNINELEYVGGNVFANIWQTDWVAIIDPDTGRVEGLVDFSGILPEAEMVRMEQITRKKNVLNGIAYLSDSDRLFVTGKNWPFLYEVELVYRGTQ